MHVLSTWLYPLRPQLSAQAPSYSNCSMNIWMIDWVNKIFRHVYQINLPHFLSCEYYGFWLILCNLFFFFLVCRKALFFLMSLAVIFKPPGNVFSLYSAQFEWIALIGWHVRQSTGNVEFIRFCPVEHGSPFPKALAASMLQPCLLNLALGIKTSSLNFMFSVIEKNVGVVEHEVERKKKKSYFFPPVFTNLPDQTACK